MSTLVPEDWNHRVYARLGPLRSTAPLSSNILPGKFANI